MNRRGWTKELLRQIGSQFELAGRWVDAVPYGSGHINDTFLVTCHSGRRVRYIHQRLNSKVFRNPGRLMENVAAVCRHTAEKAPRFAPAGDIERRTLRLVPTVRGESALVDDAGDTWRTYQFIEGATAHDVIVSPDQARAAARAFGQFQAMLADFPVEKLHETIPDFHETRKRLAALERAIEADSHGRAAGVRAEIDFALSRAPLAGILLDLAKAGEIPVRVTHNDTKLNNVMLDNQTGEGICVIDLDTVMPGLSLYDFGDMVRTAVSPAAEDEKDLSRVRVRPDFFEALAEGFLSTAVFLNDTERGHLLTAGKLLTFENGIRFLTDYLSGDVYYKIAREEHNLDRCRTQFRLLDDLEQKEDLLLRIADSAAAKVQQTGIAK